MEEVKRKIKCINRESAIYICAFLMPFIMVNIFFALCGIYPYGGSTVLIGDLDLEFVNFYKYFLNTFSTKNDMVYMLSKTIGGDVPGLASYYLRDPLIFMLFLFPGDKIATGVAYMFALQISLAGLSMSFLLNRRYRVSWISLIFSTAYSFSAFFFDYTELTIYFTCLALLPFIIYLFLGYLDGNNGRVPLILAVTFYIYLNYYLGFMLVIFLGLLYISRLIEDTGYIRRLKGLLCSLVTVLALDGFFLIRTVFALKGEKSTDSADYGFFRNFEFRQLFASFFSGTSRNVMMPMIYCSVTAVFFALICFMSKKYGLRKKAADLFLLLSLLVSMWINTFDSVWHGFNNPEGFLWRYSYYVSITVIVLAYRGISGIAEDSEGRASYTAKTTVVFVLLLSYIYYMRRLGNLYLDEERQIVNTVIVTFIFLVCLLYIQGGRLRIAACALFFVVSCTDMLYNAKTVYMRMNAGDGELPTIAKYEKDYAEISEAVSYVKGIDDGFYRFEKDFEGTVNDPAMFDYIGLSHDSSCERDDVIDWLTNLGFCKTVYYTYYNGGSTSFADALLGVRYYGSGFDDTFKPYERIGEVWAHGIYRNQYALPMLYAAPEGLADYEFDERNTFEKQNEVAGYWDGGPYEIYKKAEAQTELEGATETEAGHFVKDDEEAYIVYNIKVTEELPLLMYFAAPSRQSGEVFVNGESYDWYFTENHWNVLYAGTFEKGETVEIKMQILKEDLRITEACFYYEDAGALAAWARAAGRADTDIGDVEEISSSHLKAEAGAGEGQILVLSVPYDEAWKVKCDGKRVETMPVMGMLMGIRAPAGRHDIDMRYVPNGTLPGLIVSLYGIVLFAAGIVYDKRRNNA